MMISILIVESTSHVLLLFLYLAESLNATI